MLRIGLTGGIGAGKTTVSDMFAALGVTIVDADVISREVVAVGSPALLTIAKHFGEGILLESGELDRAQMRTRIFKDADAKQWLEQLLHPLIRQETLSQLDHAAGAYVILSSPLLLETDQHRLVDRIVVVDIPETLQLERASARDKNKRDQIQAIIDQQIPRRQRLARADDVIDNSLSLEATRTSVEQLHAHYTHLADSLHA